MTEADFQAEEVAGAAIVAATAVRTVAEIAVAEVVVAAMTVEEGEAEGGLLPCRSMGLCRLHHNWRVSDNH